MEILGILIFSLIVIVICIVVIKVSFVEAEAEKSSITLFFLRKDMDNPEMLIKQLCASYYGKIIIVNIDGTDRSCSICKMLCENNSHLSYCELSNMKETIKDEYLNVC
ncbi:MAG: hypothetical protein ACI4WH_00235 [Oscillospiraceae bacterium]